MKHRPVGPHRRKMWTPRTVRRMLRCPYGLSDREGPRPGFTILVPSDLGTLSDPKDIGDCISVDWWDLRVQKLLKAIEFVKTAHDRRYPYKTKYFNVGVFQGRWFFNGHLYDRASDNGYRESIEQLSSFINCIQAKTNTAVTVYGHFDPISKWSGERYEKVMSTLRYMDLRRKYPEPR